MLVVACASLLLLLFGFPRANQTESSSLRPQVLGVALTVDHASVSILYRDGSFKELGRVEGNEEYISLMQRFSP
jgi:hypothetical protein